MKKEVKKEKVIIKEVKEEESPKEELQMEELKKNKKIGLKKKGLVIGAVLIGVVAVIAMVMGGTINKKETNKISYEEELAKEEKVENVDYNTILGKWYCFETFKEMYEFKADGTAFYEYEDIDESEEEKKRQKDEYESLTEEEKKEHDKFKSEISDYTYTLKDNKGKLKSKYSNYEFEYIEDGKNSRLLVVDKSVTEDQVDDGKWTFYKTWSQAKKNSTEYKQTLEYINSIADEDGWAIEDNKLLGYVGKKKSVTVPKNVESIEPSAFSWDMGRAVKVEKIIVGGNVKVIRSGSFAFCKADKIVIKNGVKEIEDFAFMDSYIDDISFPPSITKIGNVIMQTEEGLDGCVIHCKKGSPIAKYMEEDKPYGIVKIKYDYRY